MDKRTSVGKTFDYRPESVKMKQRRKKVVTQSQGRKLDDDRVSIKLLTRATNPKTIKESYIKSTKLAPQLQTRGQTEMLTRLSPIPKLNSNLVYTQQQIRNLKVRTRIQMYNKKMIERIRSGAVQLPMDVPPGSKKVLNWVFQKVEDFTQKKDPKVEEKKVNKNPIEKTITVGRIILEQPIALIGLLYIIYRIIFDRDVERKKPEKLEPFETSPKKEAKLERVIRAIRTGLGYKDVNQKIPFQRFIAFVIENPIKITALGIVIYNRNTVWNLLTPRNSRDKAIKQFVQLYDVQAQMLESAYDQFLKFTTDLVKNTPKKDLNFFEKINKIFKPGNEIYFENFIHDLD